LGKTFEVETLSSVSLFIRSPDADSGIEGLNPIRIPGISPIHEKIRRLVAGGIKISKKLFFLSFVDFRNLLKKRPRSLMPKVPGFRVFDCDLCSIRRDYTLFDYNPAPRLPEVNPQSAQNPVAKKNSHNAV